jgi:uncharacterized protein (DUF433 family)
MSVETRYEHVVLDENGTPTIAKTTIKVRELVAERLAWGWSPEELLVNHPDLTLGQIYSALAYYADHQAVIDKEIEKDAELAADLKQKAGRSPLLRRLKAQGLI